MKKTQLQRLIVCFDGTWNTPETQTNVSRLFAAIADENSGCAEQLKFYDAGVGTTRRTKITGGLFGLGLDRNVLEGYCWLCNCFAPPAGTTGAEFLAIPELFLFGFSRGAFTARSLAGMINRCGLIRRDRLGEGPATPESPLVRAAWNLYKEKLDGEARDNAKCVRFRAENSWTAEVKFLGVWDTVGALGVPMLRSAALPVLRGQYQFHDQGLGRVVRYAYHALAIDEQREDYEATLWTKRHDLGTKAVEQRWFPGAHSNVGGGYEDDLLPDPPLRWIAKCALEQGLEFIDEAKLVIGEASCARAMPKDFELSGDEYLSAVRDSYGEFMFGVYRVARGLTARGRYYRPMLTTGVGETIDDSALLKWKADSSYRPRNLAYAGRRDFERDG